MGLSLGATACGEDAREETQWTGPVPPATGAGDAGTSSETESADASDDTGGESSDGDGREQTSVADASTGDDTGDPDYSNIARLQVPPTWLTKSDDTWSYDLYAELPPDYEIAREFYVEHADDYDLLVVYTEVDVAEVSAHALGVQENISGIRYGEEPSWSQAQAAGSAGRLQQINFMNAPTIYPDPAAADILIHEALHRWSAGLGLQSAPSPGSLLGPAGGHWNIHVSTGGPSATGYGELIDTGGGSFRFDVVYPLQISPLELYVAGLIPAAEVPPLFYVTNATGYEPAIDPWDDAFWTHDLRRRRHVHGDPRRLHHRGHRRFQRAARAGFWSRTNPRLTLLLPISAGYSDVRSSHDLKRIAEPPGPKPRHAETSAVRIGAHPHAQPKAFKALPRTAGVARAQADAAVAEHREARPRCPPAR